MLDDPTRVVLAAARDSARDSSRPLVLAVSGGLDSMALLNAMAQSAPSCVAAVATFDHGTGAAASEAVRHVGLAAGRAGLPFVTARMNDAQPTAEGREAAWRKARYEFLHATAERLGAAVVTAHTADDQVETVLLRIMRGTGARGLAALYARSAIVRPFLMVRRVELHSYALGAGVTWVDDPSNSSREFARNRVRLDLLPAIRSVHPVFGEELLALARKAERLRRDVESFVDGELRPRLTEGNRLVVASGELMDYDADSHAILWPALAGRVGLALDARGIRRIASFASSRPCDGSIPLAGGWCLEATRDTYTLRKSSPPASSLQAASLPSSGTLAWGNFRFRVSKGATVGSTWTASIAAPDGAVVRQWVPGDRLEAAGGQQPRRVKRYLSDAGVRGADRAQWPVVVAGDEIVWIPGVRRSDAATDRSGRPARHYICERNDR
jgi:tRNA(Ile)-lysidine synthase